MDEFNYADELRKFHKLYEDGIISQEDFENKKKELLATPSIPTTSSNTQKTAEPLYEYSNEHKICYALVSAISLICALWAPALGTYSLSLVNGKVSEYRGVVSLLGHWTTIISLAIALLAVISAIMLIKNKFKISAGLFLAYDIMLIISRYAGGWQAVRPGSYVNLLLMILMGFALFSDKIYKRYSDKKVILTAIMVVLGTILLIYGFAGTRTLCFNVIV